MKHISYAAAVVVLGSLVACAADHTKDSLDQVRQNLQNKKAVLIDVREMGEWKRGHLKDASLVPLSELKKLATDPAVAKKHAEHLPKDKIIYCHCGSGVRVINAADILGKMGYDIRALKAGYGDLIDAGFPQAVEQ